MLFNAFWSPLCFFTITTAQRQHETDRNGFLFYIPIVLALGATLLFLKYFRRKI
jgi:hypothetical protein